MCLLSASCKPTPIQSTPGRFSQCVQPTSHVHHLHLLAKVKQRWSYTCFPLTPCCVHADSRTTVLVLVTSFLPSCYLTQQKVTKYWFVSRRFCFLRGPGDYYLECLRKFGNAAGLWKMQDGPT